MYRSKEQKFSELPTELTEELLARKKLLQRELDEVIIALEQAGVVFYIQQCAKELERVPGAQAYDTWLRQHSIVGYDASVARYAFGSWIAAQKAAGFEPIEGSEEYAKLFKKFAQKYTEEDCSAALKRVAGIVGHSPSASEYRQYCNKTEPRAETLLKRVSVRRWDVVLNTYLER